MTAVGDIHSDLGWTAQVGTVPDPDLGPVTSLLTALRVSRPMTLPRETPARRADAPTGVPAQDDKELPTVSAGGSSFPVWVRKYARGIALVDLISAVVCGSLALVWRFGISDGAVSLRYLAITAGFALMMFLIFAFSRCYEPRFLAEGTEEFRRLGQAAVRFTAVFAMVSFAFNLDIARGYAFVALPLTLSISVLARVLVRTRLRRQRSTGKAKHRVLVLGTERASAELIRLLATNADGPYDVVGVLTDLHRSSHVEDVRVVGSSAEARIAVTALGADAVMVAPWSPITQDELRRLSWELADLDVDLLISPNLTDVAGARIHIQPVAGLPLLHVAQPEFTGIRRIMKGAFDRCVAFVALILLAPALIATAIVVRLTSPGPALFGQERVGRDGQPFTMYKFRSMYLDAEDRLIDLTESNTHVGGPLFKMANDPRITRVGRWTRRYSIDELPQLINVVRGEMSLVGPRPQLPSEVAQYENDVHRRLLVKPGITGLWQVSGRSDLSWDESVRLDLDYVENWSVLVDVAILFRTSSAVFAAKGAY